MSNIRRPILITVIIFTFLIIGLLVSILLRNSNEWTYPTNEVSITDFGICSSPDADSKFSDVDVIQIPNTYSQVYACGFLNSAKKASLHMYLFKSGSTLPIYSDPSELFRNGFFTFLLKLPDSNRIGNYHVEIYFFRLLLASREFEVISP